MISESIKNGVIFGCEGPRLSEVEFDFFKQTLPFGFILFSRNIVNSNGSYRTRIRGGVMLVIGEGLCLKAPKVQKLSLIHI